MAKRITKEDVDRFHDYGLYLPTRTVYIGSMLVDFDDESGTDAFMAERAVKNLLILDHLNHENITIIMNNLGGTWEHGMAIYDAIKGCNSHVKIKVSGSASSMGSVILQAASERVMSPNSQLMIHYGFNSVEGHPKTVQKVAKEFQRIDKKMEKIYLEKIKEKQPHFSLYKLEKMLEHDTYLWAEEAVELGLADSIEE